MEKGALRTSLAALGGSTRIGTLRVTSGPPCPHRHPAPTGHPPLRKGTSAPVNVKASANERKFVTGSMRRAGGGPVTQPAEGVVMRLLAPTWCRGRGLPGTRRRSTRAAAASPGLHRPRLTPGAPARLRRELLLWGSWARRRVYRRNGSLLTSKRRMGGELSQPRLEPFSETRPPAAARHKSQSVASGS